MKSPGRLVRAVAAGGVCALGAAVLLAIVLALVDLYLTGHGQPGLARPWIAVPEWGVHVSRADAILLGGVLLAALAGGWMAVILGRSPGAR